MTVHFYVYTPEELREAASNVEKNASELIEVEDVEAATNGIVSDPDAFGLRPQEVYGVCEYCDGTGETWQTDGIRGRDLARALRGLAQQAELAIALGLHGQDAP